MNSTRAEIAVALLLLCTLALPHASNGDPVGKLIYGGEEATPGEFSWMVSIQTPKFDMSSYIHICGGTLISPTKVVTAAHCVANIHGYPAGSVRIVAGAHRITDHEDSQQIRAIYASGIHVHHLYSRDDDIYDVAVIELVDQNPFLITDRVNWPSPANMPSENQSSSGVCQIAGWGSTPDLFTSEVLMRADIPIVSKTDCRLIYEDKFHPQSQICAGRPEGGVDTCMGDTGGAIICDNNGTTPKFFAGIAVGGGQFCGSAGYPGIYAEVSHIINWIINPLGQVGEVEQVVEPFLGQAN